MIALAAHTGARRSEILRSQKRDVNLKGRSILLREKKRQRGKRTMRRVPLTERLVEAIEEWFDVHPGGSSTFCYGSIPS